ncbi:MAG TPA: hypothetical protein VKX46_07340 [Ktedonobacteraceae bacterium]|nr:hypothetical protein [Ktedonobacteraceae bacterium]
MKSALTREAVEKTQHIVRATEVLQQQAPAIAQTCAEAETDTIVVATVEQDCSYGGAYAVPRSELRERVMHLEDEEGKWTLTLDPLTSVQEIEKRCSDIGRLASRRGAAIQRWLNTNA